MLACFIAGDLDDASAVEVAHHLDSCPPCRQRAFAEDDLHTILMEADEDALPPADLVPTILASAPLEQAPHQEGRVPVLAMAMLAAAGLLFAMMGNPADLVADGAAWGRGLTLAATAVGGPSGLGGWIAAPGLAAVAGAVLWAASQRSRHR